MSPTTDEPYNSDPMDQPAPERSITGWAKVMERFILTQPREPAFTWDQIRAAAAVEWEARLRESAFQKNFGMVDWLLDNPPENVNPNDLLYATQRLTRNTHEVME